MVECRVVSTLLGKFAFWMSAELGTTVCSALTTVMLAYPRLEVEKAPMWLSSIVVRASDL